MGVISDIHGHFRRRDLNQDGQPNDARLRSKAIADRQVGELIGMIRMVMADGEIEHHEAEFLLQWLEANEECANRWPITVLYPRIVAALQDGIIEPHEEADLLTLLVQTIGRPEAPNPEQGANYATALPLTTPPPPVVFADRTFCFTGKLYSGTRKWALDQVSQRGGLPMDSITKKLDYLVIGEIGSRDWVQSTHGRKIEKAVAYANDGCPLVIISEQHWAGHL